MDPLKTGALIRRLRTEQSLTQLELSEILHVSDKTVSKWETGKGCPDIAILRELASVFGCSTDLLLSGEYPEKERNSPDMRKTVFHVCPDCGNILTASSEAEVVCCGKKLSPLVPRKAEEHEFLQMEAVDGEWYITTEHEMTKEHYIAFVALMTDSMLVMSRQYPEWNLQARFPYTGRGRLVWYCSRCGLLYRDFLMKRS